MHLYLMRHGLAEEGVPGQPDRDRQLTPEGHYRLHRQVRALARMDWPITHVLTSPYRRAVETARPLADLYRCEIIPEQRLALYSTPVDYLELFARFDRHDHVFAVSHQPDIEAVIHLLTGATVAIRKGSIAVVRLRALAPGGGRLEGLYDPDVLAALGTD